MPDAASPDTGGSPYAAALGDRARDLPDSLRAYFSTIPPGHVGRGEGVFEVFGSPHRWLDPMLGLLAQRGVVAAGAHRDVAFRIENRTVHGRAAARRTIALPGGDWTMTDAVHVTSRGTVVDVIGAPATVAAEFELAVVDGAVELRSVAVGLRLGRLRLRLPRPVAPIVRLRESAAADRQRILLTVDAPLLGRVYEYRGTFAYRIEPDHPRVRKDAA